MPLNIMDLLQPVYETILAIYTQPPMKGLPPGNQMDDTFLTLNWPGQAIDEQQYGNAWSPQNPSGSQDAVENISLLADAIPNLAPQYDWSGYSVESIYQQILDAKPIRVSSANKEVNDAGLSASRATDMISATDVTPTEIDTSAFLNEVGRRTDVTVPTEGGTQVELVSVSDDTFEESELQAAYSDAAASLNAKRLEFNLSDPTQLQQWKSIAPGYENAVQAAWNALQSHQSRQELKSLTRSSSLLESRSSNSLDLSASVGAPDSLDAQASDNAGFDEDPILRAFTQAKNIFQNSRLGSVKNPGSSYHPTYVTPANFADPKAAASWPSIQNLPTQIRSDSGMENSRVTFKFTRVNLIRPWLLLSLLKLSGWQVRGMSPGDLSNGRKENNYGQFALLPTAMIVVRDLSITSLGTNASTSDSYQLLNATGLQVLAWVNKIVPFSPPAK
jgi:hypothetical protein